jgi:uncharacterized protein (TIGR02996 family)
MTHDEAFLQDVLARPGDDGPRLIYADWLEDHGQEARAEFIRTQCELAKLPRRDPRRLGLEGIEYALLAMHEAEWVGKLELLVRGWGFRRGFVHRVRMDTADFLAYHDELFRLAPVRRVKFEGATGLVPRLADCPALARLIAIDLSGNELKDADARALAASLHLRRLRRLRLAHNDIGDGGVEALAASPNLPRLIWLDLATNRVGRVGADALLRTTFLRKLKRLHLGCNRIARRYGRWWWEGAWPDPDPGAIGREQVRALKARFGSGTFLPSE